MIIRTNAIQRGAGKMDTNIKKNNNAHMNQQFTKRYNTTYTLSHVPWHSAKFQKRQQSTFSTNCFETDRKGKTHDKNAVRIM